MSSRDLIGALFFSSLFVWSAMFITVLLLLDLNKVERMAKIMILVLCVMVASWLSSLWFMK